MKKGWVLPVLKTCIVGVFVFAMLVNIVETHAKYIDVISQQYAVRGYGEGFWDSPPETHVYIWDLTSDEPLSENLNVHGREFAAMANYGFRLMR